MLYVRTEARPGAKEPEHLFVHTEDRVVFQRWLPGGDVPPDWSLAIDHLAIERADRAEARARKLQAEVDALIAALREAIGLVPPSQQDRLREVYRRAKE